MTTHPILGQVAPVESLGRATLEAIEASGGCSISKMLADINARGLEIANHEPDSLSLKWGTLKSWHLHSEKGVELLRRYHELGTSASAMMVNDTPEQKELICQMIDACNSPTIYLEWDDKNVSKDEAKRYVMEYTR